MSYEAVLVDKVRSLLDDPAAISSFDRTFDATGLATPEQELSALNTYWRKQLCNVGAKTTSERECLMDDIQSEDWLRHFKSIVLPTIKRFQLPK